MQTIFKKIDVNMDGILTSTTTLHQNGSGSNSNEGALYTPQISEASPSDIV